MAGTGAEVSRDTWPGLGYNLRWDEDLLKAEIADWPDTIFPAGHAIAPTMLSGESHTTQEELTSVAADSSGHTRAPQLEGSPPRRASAQEKQPQQSKQLLQSRGRKTPKHSGSPREWSSDSGGGSQELRHKRERRSYADLGEKPDPTTAARTKASRERQRRERLNDSFMDLTRTLDPNYPTKAEKTVIITDTIKAISSVRAENSRLWQEKDQLQEHIGRLEKEKQELQFQHSLLKNELEAAYIAKYSHPVHHALQQSMGLGYVTEGVAVGVPVRSSHLQRKASGGIAHLLQDPGSMQRNTSLQSTSHQEGQQPNAHDHGQHQQQQQVPSQPQAVQTQEHLPVMSEGLMGASPPDFADLDLNIGEDLAAFADQMSSALPLDMSHTIEWLPTPLPADNAESSQHAASRQPGA